MGNEASQLADKHFGPDSDLRKHFDKHFGPDSDFARNFAPDNKKIVGVSFDSFYNDDRVFEETKEAIRALPPKQQPGQQKPEDVPQADWTKAQTAKWWEQRHAEMASHEAEWGGPLPQAIDDCLVNFERLVQGVSVRITRRKDSAKLPVVMYMHGGGFGGVASFKDVAYKSYVARLAALGRCVVISIDFCSIAKKSFAAALDDCIRVTQAAANGKITGVRGGPVLLAGNSTGGTLALATAIKANQQGWVEKISGIYTICPFVDGVASTPKYPSMAEFDGYYISQGYLQGVVNMVKDEVRTTPKLFPMDASRDDLKGLPPVKIIVFQLDMVRDMGIAMHFKLMKAGVEASFNIVSGGVHDQQLFTLHSPECTESSINDLAQFSNYAGIVAGLDVQMEIKSTRSISRSSIKSSGNNSVGSAGGNNNPAATKTANGGTTSPSKAKRSNSSKASTKALIENGSTRTTKTTTDDDDNKSTGSNRSSKSNKSARRNSFLSRAPPKLERKPSTGNKNTATTTSSKPERKPSVKKSATSAKTNNNTRRVSASA